MPTRQLLAVRQPDREGTGRGVGYVLERRVDGAYALTHYLTATADEEVEAEPTWVEATAGAPGWREDIGFNGLGPDLVVVPETAPPGDHRICTATSAENICVEVVVAAAT